MLTMSDQEYVKIDSYLRQNSFQSLVLLPGCNLASFMAKTDANYILFAGSIISFIFKIFHRNWIFKTYSWGLIEFVSVVLPWSADVNYSRSTSIVVHDGPIAVHDGLVS